MQVAHIGPHTLYCADCRDVLPTLGPVGAIVADPPFSKRTHDGHNASANGHAGMQKDKAIHGEIPYAAWGKTEITSAVKRLPPAGWVCIITDHTLAPVWAACLEGVGRYVFAPIPIVTVGRSVRLSGDGPSSWTDWMIPARTPAQARWGTLPGVYMGNPSEIKYRGGKPLGAMCQIVADYSRVKDVVLDFTMGGGTTGEACIRTGRTFIGIESNKAAFDAACKRIEDAMKQPALFDHAELERPRARQLALAAG